MEKMEKSFNEQSQELAQCKELLAANNQHISDLEDKHNQNMTTLSSCRATILRYIPVVP